MELNEQIDNLEQKLLELIKLAEQALQELQQIYSQVNK